AAERFQAATDRLASDDDQALARGRLYCRIAILKRFSDPTAAITAIDEAARIASRIGDAVLAAKTHWLRGLFLSYADRFREGITELILGFGLLKEVLGPTGAASSLQAWFTEALPVAKVPEIGDIPSITWPADVDDGFWGVAAYGRFLASAGRAPA